MALGICYPGHINIQKQIEVMVLFCCASLYSGVNTLVKPFTPDGCSESICIAKNDAIGSVCQRFFRGLHALGKYWQILLIESVFDGFHKGARIFGHVNSLEMIG